MNKTPKSKKFEIKVDVWLEHEMLYSKPFRLLSAKTAWVLLRFLQKRKWHHKGKRNRKPVFNNEGIAFPYAEANHFGISTSTFHTSIKRLVEMGFIDVDHQGGAYGHDYSRFNISDRWRKYGTPEFKEVIKKRVLQGGLDVRSHQRAKLKVTTENRSYLSTENRSYEPNP
jgi:hypothetical protein